MVAPSVTPFTLISGAPATMVNPTIPGVLNANRYDTNQSSFRFQIPFNDGVTYGARRPLPAGTTDLSQSLIMLSMGGSVASNQGRVSFFSGVLTELCGMGVAVTDSLGNWRRWTLSGGNIPDDTRDSIMVVDLAQTSTMQAQSATPPDLTQINAIEFHAQSNGTGTADILCRGVWAVDKTLGATILGGEVANLATMQSLLIYQNSQTGLNFVRNVGDEIFSLGIPVTLSPDRGEVLGATIVFRPRAVAGTPIRPPHIHHTRQALNINIPNNGRCDILTTQLKNTEGFVVSSNANPGATGIIRDSLFIGFDSVDFSSALALRNSVFSGFGEATLNGASQNNATFTDGTALNINALGANKQATYTDISSGINFNLPPGNYSDFRAALEPEQLFNITQGTGEYTLTGLVGGTESSPVVIDNTGGGDVVFVVGAEIFAVAADPVTAGSVSIQAPQSQIVIVGLPVVDNVRLLVRNLTEATQQFFTVVGGTINIPTVATSIYELRADAPGYLASDYIELPGNTPQFRFNLINRRDVYDAGVTRFDRVIFNPPTFEIFITYGPPLSFEDVFRTLEDYLVILVDGVVSGLLYTAHPIPITIPGRQILRFVYDQVNDTLNPARLKPHPDNLTDPELLFEIELERAEDFGLDPTYALLDYSDAPAGRIIRVRSQVAIANVTISGEGALTPEQDTRLTTLFNATTAGTGATAFSTAALANAPTSDGGSSGPTEAQIYGYFTAEGRANAFKADVSGLSTFDPASHTVARVTLVDLTTANTDMRGTDGAITAIGDVTVGGYVDGQSPADLVAGFATPANVTAARDAILTQGNAAWTTANISALLTAAAYSDSLPPNYDALEITPDGLVTTSNPGTGATAAEVWASPERLLTGAQAERIGDIAEILTDTSTTLPAQITALPAPLNATATQAAAAAALTAYPAAKPSDVQVTVEPEVTVDGGFTGADRSALTGLATTIGTAGAGLTEAGGTGDQFTGIPASATPVLANVTQVAGVAVAGVSAFRADVSGLATTTQVQASGFTTARNNALEIIDLRMQELYQRQGLDVGVTATVVDPTVSTPGSLIVREGATVLISQTLTKPDEDTVTIERDA